MLDRPDEIHQMQYVVLKTTYYDTNITISIYKSQQTNADDLRQKPLKCTAERADFYVPNVGKDLEKQSHDQRYCCGGCF